MERCEQRQTARTSESDWLVGLHPTVSNNFYNPLSVTSLFFPIPLIALVLFRHFCENNLYQVGITLH